MKKTVKLFFLALMLVVAPNMNANAASLFLVPNGAPVEDKDVMVEVVPSLSQTFSVYLDVVDISGFGIYNVGIEVNYNPNVYSGLASAPTIDSMWSIPPSKIINPGDDAGDNVTGNDFGVYVSDEDFRGYNGRLHIVDFTLSVIGSPANDPLLVWLGDYGPGDDTIDLDFNVYDDAINYRVANAVPVSGAFYLLGTGLLGLIGIRRRMG